MRDRLHCPLSSVSFDISASFILDFCEFGFTVFSSIPLYVYFSRASVFYLLSAAFHSFISFAFRFDLSPIFSALCNRHPFLCFVFRASIDYVFRRHWFELAIYFWSDAFSRGHEPGYACHTLQFSAVFVVVPHGSARRNVLCWIETARLQVIAGMGDVCIVSQLLW